MLRQLVKVREYRALDFELLRQVFLHEIGTSERIGQVLRDAHAPCRRRSIMQEAMADQILEPVCHGSACRLGNASVAIIERDVEPAARKHDSPGAAYQTRPNDGDARHG